MVIQLELYLSPKVLGQVSHPHKTTDKTTVLCSFVMCRVWMAGNKTHVELRYVMSWGTGIHKAVFIKTVYLVMYRHQQKYIMQSELDGKGQFHQSWFETEKMPPQIKNWLNLCVASGGTVGTVRSVVGCPLVVTQLCWGLRACGVCPVRSTKERNTRPPLLTVHKSLSSHSTFSSTTHLCVCVCVFVCMHICVCLCVCDCVPFFPDEGYSTGVYQNFRCKSYFLD